MTMLSLTEIAELCGVRATAVSNWRSRHSTFPAGLQTTGKELLFQVNEIARWLDNRRIARNALKPGEDPGTTYGERFLRNLSGENTDPAGGRQAKQTQPLAQVLANLVRLRGSYHWDAFVELVLGLLYVRARLPELWQDLLTAGDPVRIWDQLEQVELPGELPLRVFESSTHTADSGHQTIELLWLLDEVDLPGTADAALTASSLAEQMLAWDSSAWQAIGHEHFTPGSLVRLMVAMTDPQAGERIHDPAAKSGELLVAAAGKAGDALVSAHTLTERSWRLSRLNAAVHSIEPGLGTGPRNVLRRPFSGGHEFDIVLSNPPFGRSPWFDEQDGGGPWPFGEPPRHRDYFAWLQHAVRTLAPRGRAAILMPDATTFSSGTEQEIRARMAEAGVVECVVSLPPGLFRSSGIRATLWILRATGRQARDILLVNAAELGTMADRAHRVLSTDDIAKITAEYRAWRQPGYRPTAGFAQPVNLTTVRERNYLLSPPGYVAAAMAEPSLRETHEAVETLKTDLVHLRARATEVAVSVGDCLAGVRNEPDSREGWTETRLGDVCEVLAGPGTVDRGERQPDWVPVVRPMNLRHNRIVEDELVAVNPRLAMELHRYRLAPGDIVCSRTGTLGKYGLVAPEQYDWLLGPGCMRLRPGHDTDANYLVHHLTGPDAQQWLSTHTAGSVITYISTSRLSQMPLTLPPLAAQRRIGSILAEVNSEIAVHLRIAATAQTLQEQLTVMLTRHPVTRLPAE